MKPEKRIDIKLKVRKAASPVGQKGGIDSGTVASH